MSRNIVAIAVGTTPVQIVDENENRTLLMLRVRNGATIYFGHDNTVDTSGDDSGFPWTSSDPPIMDEDMAKAELWAVSPGQGLVYKWEHIND